MRRPPALVWILAPLVVGIAYGLLRPLFEPAPTLADVVPADAILTHRYRDKAALDRAWYGGSSGPFQPSERIAARRNVPGLPGVDVHRPIHLVFTPREQRSDATLMVFPLADAKSFRERFEDPQYFLEKGFQRHHQFLEIRGDFAAVGGDRGTVRQLGTGGISAPVLGEDHVLAVRLPEMIRYMLVSALEPPWRGILRALGFDAREARVNEVGEVDVTGRVARVHDAWRTARLWSWLDERRIRADLAPSPDAELAVALEALAARGGQAPPTPHLPPAPADALAWIRASGSQERQVLVRALWSAGLDLSAADLEGDGGLLVYAEPSAARPRAWTILLAAPKGTLPDPAALHPALAADAAEGERSLEFPEADVPWLAPGRGTKNDEARVARVIQQQVGTLDIVAVGTTAERAWRGFETHLAIERSPETAIEPPEAGFVLVATFGWTETRARTLFRSAFKEGGFLPALAGGDVTGEIWTDGRILRVEARAHSR